MGATIVGTAAAAHDLELSSFAMWDPCESGRAYARELAVLGALRRDANAVGLGESTKMLEYPLSDKVARHIGDFTLIESDSSPLAERVLVVVRDDRTVSDSFGRGGTPSTLSGPPLQSKNPYWRRNCPAPCSQHRRSRSFGRG